MSNSVLIAPSILSANFGTIAEEVATIASADLVHVDVMDGRFVPVITFGQDVLRAVKQSSKLSADVHLMVEEPERIYQSFLDAGADILTFHIEATRHARAIIDGIHAAGRKAGVALNPGTPVSVLESVIDIVDLVLVLSVNPGQGGQSFMESTWGKLAVLHELCQKHGASPLVEIDGGVSAANAGELAAAGASVLVAGSAVFGRANRAEAIEAIRQAAKA